METSRNSLSPRMTIAATGLFGSPCASSRRQTGHPRMMGLRTAFEENRLFRSSVQAFPTGCPVQESKSFRAGRSRSAVSHSRSNASCWNWMNRIILKPRSIEKSVAVAAFIAADRDRNENTVSRGAGTGWRGTCGHPRQSQLSRKGTMPITLATVHPAIRP